MTSCSPTLKRAKPLLGTFVSITVEGLASELANHAIDDGFNRIARVHHRMSFQDANSDVAQLNRRAHLQPIEVDGDTYEVLQLAADISSRSDGVFDITVSPALSSLPWLKDQCLPTPDEQARWSDVELLPNRQVRFARPLWIDVSGIAKGYAVDKALEVLSTHAPRQAYVNAGGDLRHSGDESIHVRLDVPLEGQELLPLVELKNGALASSGPRSDAVAGTECEFVNGAARQIVVPRFVSVLAEQCAIADALTKVVMALGNTARDVLRHYQARALLHEAGAGWCEVA